MTDSFTSSNKINASKISFFLSLLVFLFWFLGGVVNVYRFSIIGAIFEILWFPLILMTFILPISSFIFWAKEKFNLRSLYLYSFFIVLATGLLIVFMY